MEWAIQIVTRHGFMILSVIETPTTEHPSYKTMTDRIIRTDFIQFMILSVTIKILSVMDWAIRFHDPVQDHKVTFVLMEWAIQIVTDRIIKPWRTVYDYLDSSFHDGIVTDRIIKPWQTVYDPVRHYLDSSFHDGQGRAQYPTLWSWTGSWNQIAHSMTDRIFIVTNRIINCIKSVLMILSVMVV